MENRVTARLEYDGWNVTTFPHLYIGDMVHFDDIPGTWRVDSLPLPIVNENGNTTLAFEAMPISKRHLYAPIDYQ